MWFVYAMVAAIFWGINYALAEKIGQSISLITLLALEMLVGSIFAFIAAYFTSLKIDLSILWANPSLMRLTLIEIIVITLASFCILLSIQTKNATVAGLIELTYPLFTILFTWCFFNENHLSLPIMIGGGFISIGVLFIALA